MVAEVLEEDSRNHARYLKNKAADKSNASQMVQRTKRSSDDDVRGHGRALHDRALPDPEPAPLQDGPGNDEGDDCILMQVPPGENWVRALQLDI